MGRKSRIKKGTFRHVPSNFRLNFCTSSSELNFLVGLGGLIDQATACGRGSDVNMVSVDGGVGTPSIIIDVSWYCGY